MKIDRSLKRRISRTFLLQAGAISIAAVVSVYLAALVIKQVLVTEALRMEATYFWERHAADPGFPLPDTRNLTGFLSPEGDESDLPPNLRGLSDGFHEMSRDAGFTTVYVTTEGSRRLYLVFDGERVNELAAYFGLVPLAVVLLVLYLSVWLAFRASQRAVSPVAWLAREVNLLDPDDPDAGLFAPERLPRDADQEVQVLASALGGFANRLESFVERERTFTRDASHELRTPLTVIRIASDILLKRGDLPAQACSSIERIRRASADMERLVEAFLLLARESDKALPAQRVCINDVVSRELGLLELIAQDKPIEAVTRSDCVLWVRAPEGAVAAVIANLLRNAFTYTDAGTITVRIEPRRLSIEDSGIGMGQKDIEAAFEPFFRGDTGRTGGHGVGLTIVRRFSDRFHWPVRIRSQPGAGTIVEVDFPNAESLPVDKVDSPSNPADDRT